MDEPTDNQAPSIADRVAELAGAAWAKACDLGAWLEALARGIISNVVKAIAVVAPLVATACAGDDAVHTEVEAAAVSAGPQVHAKAAHPEQLGQFDVTFYYVVGEDEVTGPSDLSSPQARLRVEAAVAAAEAAATDPTSLAAGAGADAPLDSRVTIFHGGDCAPLAKVSPEFAEELTMQGTGRLRDGRIVNVWGACRCGRSPCFQVSGRQWGTAGTGRPLTPFRTVAVDPKLIKLGSLLYIPLLDGLAMPGKAPWGGYVHDGCVAADDTGGAIGGHQIDLFVGRRSYYQSLGRGGSSHSWARHADVLDGSSRCQRKDGRVSRIRGAS